MLIGSRSMDTTAMLFSKSCKSTNDHFKEGLGTLKGYRAKIRIIPGVSPRVCKPCSVSYSMLPLVDEELDRLVVQGVIEPVQFQIVNHPLCQSSRVTKPLSVSVVTLNSPWIRHQSWTTTPFQGLKNNLPSRPVGNCSQSWISATHISNCS